MTEMLCACGVYVRAFGTMEKWTALSDFDIKYFYLFTYKFYRPSLIQKRTNTHPNTYEYIHMPWLGYVGGVVGGAVVVW